MGGAPGPTAGPLGNIDAADISRAWSHDLHELEREEGGGRACGGALPPSSHPLLS